MHNIIFIDYNLESAGKISRKLIANLWENDFKTLFYIRGKVLSEDKRNFNNNIFYKIFVSYLVDKGIDNDTEKVKVEGKKITSREFDEYSLFADVVRSLGKMNSDGTSLEQGINDFIAKTFSKEDIIMLNLSLFDKKYFRKGINQYMELYNALKKNGYNCFLYSTYVSPEWNSNELYGNYCEKYGITEKEKMYRSDGGVIGKTNRCEGELINDILEILKNK